MQMNGIAVSRLELFCAYLLSGDVSLKDTNSQAAKQDTSCQYFLGVSVRITPAGLAEVDRQFVLLVADGAVCAALQQILDNLHMAAHSRPVQRRVVTL